MAEEVTGWPCDEGELAACFTAHSRDLFGYACVLSDADRALAGDLVQAAFEAAATAWGTLRGLPADQCRHWLHERLAAEAQSRTGHPAGSASVSPAHRRLTELKMARYRSDYDTAAGLDRFAGWLSARADGARSAPGDGAPGLRLARLHAVPDGASHDGRDGASHDRRDGTSHDGTSHDGRDGTGRTRKAAPPGSHGDPVSALYEEHYASLVRLAALLVRDTATAEEIVQDSFVTVGAAWRRHADTDGALDVLRQSVLDRSRSALRHGIPPAGGPAGGPAASPPLLAALSALPARQREVLVLRYYANLSEEQAADAIGISRAAVRRHATRANAALRTLLGTG